MEKSSRQCPICDTGKKRHIKHIRNIVPDDFILPSEYDIVACDNCGFVFNDVPQSKRYAEYYAKYKEYTNFTIPSEPAYSETKTEREGRYFVSTDFIKNNAHIGQSSAILDIGCSFGGILTILKNEGFHNLFALDLDTVSLGWLRKIGIKCKEGSIFSEDISEYTGKFDLIILGHILEHLHEPTKAISNIGKWLKDNGKIYIECPDLYQYSRTSPFPGFFTEWEHINHFSIISLMNLMNNYRLESYHTGTIYALIDRFPCLYALFEKSSETKELYKTRNDELSMLRSLTNPTKEGAKILANIEKLKDKNVAIWGAGQYCYMLLSNTSLSSRNILHIVDKDKSKHGKKLLGIEITGPEVLRGFKGTIVVCSTTAKDRIVGDIQSMQLPNAVLIPSI